MFSVRTAVVFAAPPGKPATPGGPVPFAWQIMTYLDEQSKPLFHFTKRVIRRYPSGMGTGCYHITDWIPETVQPSLKLFERAGLRGLANVEYKLDERDGQYKLIECKARFTAANCLVAASGFGLAEFVYNRIVGLPQKHLVKYRTGLRLWDPARDLSAYLERRRMGELTLFRWLASSASQRCYAGTDSFSSRSTNGTGRAQSCSSKRYSFSRRPTKTTCLTSNRVWPASG